jgi:sarcosine oxidase, subunit gamma
MLSPSIPSAISVPARPALDIRQAPDCARFSLRIEAPALPRASESFGAPLPDWINTFAATGENLAARLGPDEWHLLAPSEEADAIDGRFAELYRVVPHSLVDVSHRDIGIEIAGASAALLLSSFCPLDLDTMTPGTATRTILDRVQIVLFKHETDHFRIEVWRSFVPHVWTLLGMAAREVELGI